MKNSSASDKVLANVAYPETQSGRSLFAFGRSRTIRLDVAILDLEEDGDSFMVSPDLRPSWPTS